MPAVRQSVSQSLYRTSILYAVPSLLLVCLGPLSLALPPSLSHNVFFTLGLLI